MKLQLALFAAVWSASCATIQTGRADPFRVIPRGQAVRIESTTTCEILCAEVGPRFYFVAREARGATSQGPWLTDIRFRRWADVNRNGRWDAGEPTVEGSRSGPLSRFYSSALPDGLEHGSHPHLIEVDYVAHGELLHVGPFRLPSK